MDASNLACAQVVWYHCTAVGKVLDVLSVHLVGADDTPAALPWLLLLQRIVALHSDKLAAHADTLQVQIWRLVCIGAFP